MGSRGALYFVWGNLHPLLERSVASFKKWHPDLPIHVHELQAESTYLDKTVMYDVSPFDTTVFLDCDTVVLGDLTLGFEQAERFGVACCINEVPWVRRYAGLEGDGTEYNTGVLFFDKILAEKPLRAWPRYAREVDSSCVFNHMDGGQRVQPCNDQASLSVAFQQTGFNPCVLPLNYNFRPSYHRCLAPPVKVWHDYKDPPGTLVRLSEERANDKIIDAVILQDEVEIQANQKGLKVACAMSVPRLGFMDNFFCWVRGLASMGIFPHRHTGVFWGQCLERTMEEQLSADYILTVDYDSVFVESDVRKLIELAAKYPEADAIVPIQQRRSFLTPLFTMADENGNALRQISGEVLTQELMKVSTAHFGLTLIKAESLKKLPHPWFLPIPDSEGRWGDGRIDEDIYFWKKWAEHGFSVHVANRVPIGHMECVITWPDRDMKSHYQPVNEFEKSGKPVEVWQ